MSAVDIVRRAAALECFYAERRGWDPEAYHPGATLWCFRTYFAHRVRTDSTFRAAVEQLRGKRPACFCRPVDGFRGRVLCHAQIIAAWLDGVRLEDVP